MAQRGRPAKVLSSTDLDALSSFLQNLPFLKKNQIVALDLLKLDQHNFDETQMKVLKLADREKSLHQQRQTLLEQIKVKEQKQQKLLENEIEILELEVKKDERDYFFRLDRALESYMKIHKALLNDQIRLENERRRDVLKKPPKTLTEAQKHRNEENRRKYELGGAILAAFKKLNIDIEKSSPEQIQNRIINSQKFVFNLKNTKIFKEVIQHEDNFFEQEKLLIDVLDGLSTWRTGDKAIFMIEIEKYKNNK